MSFYSAKIKEVKKEIIDFLIDLQKPGDWGIRLGFIERLIWWWPYTHKRLQHLRSFIAIREEYIIPEEKTNDDRWEIILKFITFFYPILVQVRWWLVQSLPLLGRTTILMSCCWRCWCQYFSFQVPRFATTFFNCTPKSTRSPAVTTVSTANESFFLKSILKTWRHMYNTSVPNRHERHQEDFFASFANQEDPF